MHFLKRRKNNQTPRTHSTSGSNAQPSQPGIKSDTLDPSIAQGEAEFPVKDIDLTDRAVHKLVNEMLDQVVADVDGSNHKEEARNETNVANTTDGVTKVGRGKIDYQEESQAKMGRSIVVLSIDCFTRCLTSLHYLILLTRVEISWIMSSLKSRTFFCVFECIFEEIREI